MSTRSYWCSLGGLVTVVKARNHADARGRAVRAFAARSRPWRTHDKIRVRRASKGDLARWDALIAQDLAGIDGARVSDDDHSQEALF